MSEISDDKNLEIEPAYDTDRPEPSHAVTVAVSSCTFFNMVKERELNEDEGLEMLSTSTSMKTSP
ncbi:unnamed protein product [Coregonus sp. 'balchen']|nr:unnamed protein product [Coregonus sp. 'balchen']